MAYTNGLKKNIFLVGIIFTVTSSLFTKTFSSFPFLTMQDWLFSYRGYLCYTPQGSMFGILRIPVLEEREGVQDGGTQVPLTVSKKV